MTIDEIFSVMASHMIQGIMTHEQLMNSYAFLGLEGYAKCHEYHYISETRSYIKFCRYKNRHFSSLISPGSLITPEVIPKSWYGKVRESVDDKTRAEAIIAALNEWINWEESTVSLYKKCYSEAFTLGDIPTAKFIESYILDAEEELSFARNEMLLKSSMKFDIVSILEEQHTWKKKYKKKLKN